jgi:hypothetical protein
LSQEQYELLGPTDWQEQTLSQVHTVLGVGVGFVVGVGLGVGVGFGVAVGLGVASGFGVAAGLTEGEVATAWQVQIKCATILHMHTVS